MKRKSVGGAASSCGAAGAVGAAGVQPPGGEMAVSGKKSSGAPGDEMAVSGKKSSEAAAESKQAAAESKQPPGGEMVVTGNFSSFAAGVLRALRATTPAAKCAAVRELLGVYDSFMHGAALPDGELAYTPAHLLDAAAPSYAHFARIVHPTRIRRAKQLSSPSALARTLHSVAHIEYSAIDLALDSAYRFAPAMGPAFARDWLAVAAEEVEHFSALAAALAELGCSYGDYPVHARLHEAAAATQQSARVRMGVVHRWLEACGLDANPFVARKILASPHARESLLAPIFERIMRDEITHVNAGHRHYLAAGGRTGESFAALLGEYRQLLGKIGVLNTSAREAAGYEPGECEIVASYLRDGAQKPMHKEN